MDRTAVLAEVGGWSVGERLVFMKEDWNRIVDSGWQPVVSDEQKQELDRRLNDFDENPGNVVSWDEIVARVRRQR